MACEHTCNMLCSLKLGMSDNISKSIIKGANILSVIIPTKDRPKDLGECLASLSAQNRQADEVIIVDSGVKFPSEDVSRIWSKCLPIKYIRSTPGLTIQRNIGVTHSRGDILFFIDDDVILDNDCIRSLLNAFEEDRNGCIGGVGCEYSNIQPTSTVGKVFRLVFLLDRYSTGDIGYVQRSGYVVKLETSKASKVLVDQEWLHGVAAYRREVFGANRFEERFPGYARMEDIEFSYSVLKTGYRLKINKNATFYHKWSPSSRDDIGVVQQMAIWNRYLFFRWHFSSCKITWCCYIWSQIGECLLTAIISIRRRQLGRIRGAIKGYKNILLDIIKRVERPKKKDKVIYLTNQLGLSKLPVLVKLSRIKDVFLKVLEIQSNTDQNKPNLRREFAFSLTRISKWMIFPRLVDEAPDALVITEFSLSCLGAAIYCKFFRKPIILVFSVSDLSNSSLINDLGWRAGFILRNLDGIVTIGKQSDSYVRSHPQRLPEIIMVENSSVGEMNIIDMEANAIYKLIKKILK